MKDSERKVLRQLSQLDQPYQTVDQIAKGIGLPVQRVAVIVRDMRRRHHIEQVPLELAPDSHRPYWRIPPTFG